MTERDQPTTPGTPQEPRPGAAREEDGSTAAREAPADPAGPEPGDEAAARSGVEPDGAAAPAPARGRPVGDEPVADGQADAQDDGQDGEAGTGEPAAEAPVRAAPAHEASAPEVPAPEGSARSEPAGDMEAAGAEPAEPEPAEPEPAEVDLAPPTGSINPEPVRSTGPITRGAIADAAKLAVLGRIRAALADVPTAERPHHVRVTRAYRNVDDSPHAELVERLIDRLVDYGAAVHRVSTERLPSTILAACRAHGVKRLVVPADLPVEWRPGYAEVLVDDVDAPLDLDSLDGVDGVVTACALAIAETGTIVLDGGDWQGRRAISLIPDYHLCIVHADQIVGAVPEAVATLAEAADRPLTFISGPSATSDIELSRVEGVHGPRTLEVLLIS